MTEIQVSTLKTRDDILRLIPQSVILLHNGLRIKVNKVVVAMGGDVCVEGVSLSYSSEHLYRIMYGDIIFWGPKCIARNLEDYLVGKGVGRKTL